MKYILSLVLLFLVLDVNASCNENGCSTTIKRLYNTSLADGVVYIEVADTIAPLNCTAPEGMFLSLKSTHPLFKEIYSMLLAATISKSDVRIRMVDNSPICEVAYTWLNSL